MKTQDLSNFQMSIENGNQTTNHYSKRLSSSSDSAHLKDIHKGIVAQDLINDCDTDNFDQDLADLNISICIKNQDNDYQKFMRLVRNAPVGVF